MDDGELFMLHVWADMYKEGLCHPYFDSRAGMHRCIIEAGEQNKRAIPIYEELMRRVVLKRLK